MSIQDFGVTYTDVQRRCGFMSLTATSTPAQADVTVWIQEYAAELTHAIDYASPGLAATLTSGTHPVVWAACKGKLCARVAAEVHAINQMGAPDVAARLMGEWNGFLARLHDDPTQVFGGEADHDLHSRSDRTTGDLAGEDPVPEWTKGQML